MPSINSLHVVAPGCRSGKELDGEKEIVSRRNVVIIPKLAKLAFAPLTESAKHCTRFQTGAERFRC
jgi:hypothetical protein